MGRHPGGRGVQAAELAAPIVLSTSSIPLHNELISGGGCLTLLTASVIRTSAKPYALKVLPIELPAHRSPIGIVTLKNRTLAPVVKLFIKSAREIAQFFAGETDSHNV